MLTVGGLFSGIGGIELGLERAGMQILWHAESDEFCQHVLGERWPGVPCFPDVRDLMADTDGRGLQERAQLNGGAAQAAPDGDPRGQHAGGRDDAAGSRRLPVQAPYVDVLCGGFPCQDISLAGAGAGIAEGTRSGLWYEFARLIRDIRPRYVVVENVSALLARGLDIVLGDLAACGYDAEWDCIPASAVGAPHRRDRVWIVAYPNGQGSQGRPVPSSERAEVPGVGDGGALVDTNGERREWAWARGERRDEPADEGRGGGGHPEPGGSPVADPYSVAGTQGSARDGECGALPQPGTLERPIGRGGGIGNPWSVEPDVGRVAHGIPARVDRLRSLGNAVVPQIAEWIGSRIVAYEAEVTSARETGLR